MVRISKKHFFKEEVKKAWVPLMLLPGSLLQCSPGETHLGFVYKVQGPLSPKGIHALGLPARLAGVSPSSLSLPETPKAMICWFLAPGWERLQSR